MTRFRITVRGEGVELRGYIDSEEALHQIAGALGNRVVVVASPASDDYNPFEKTGHWSETYGKPPHIYGEETL